MSSMGGRPQAPRLSRGPEHEWVLLPDSGAPTHEHSPKHRLSRLCA